MRSVYLMCKDVPVLEYNVDKGLYNILNERLLPYCLRDKFVRIPDTKQLIKKYGEDKAFTIYGNMREKNNRLFDYWLSSRLLPVDRANAKRVALALGEDPVPRINLIYLYRGLSVTDNYWLTTSTNKKWSEVNVRKVSLSEAVALIALHGTSFTLQGEIVTPEVTNQGAYAKAWLRRDGALWLYKKGAKDSTESRIEVMASNILDKCNVRHVHYEMAEEPDPDGVESPVCCRCKCIADDEKMIITAMDYISYCNSHDIDFDRECVRIDKDMYYKMMIVDYLIANRDRHLLNWGFYVNGDTNEILSMHPLFDHNNAFDKQYMEDKDLQYQALHGKTMRASAKYAMSKVDFHFTEEITRKDFITDRQYDCFMSRAKELGIRTDKNEMLNWCRDNAVDSLKQEPEAILLQHMRSKWLQYLRNEYGKPN